MPYSLALTVGLGLPGLVEPCSVGANVIFLGHQHEKDRDVRLRETSASIVCRGPSSRAASASPPPAGDYCHTIESSEADGP